MEEKLKELVKQIKEITSEYKISNLEILINKICQCSGMDWTENTNGIGVNGEIELSMASKIEEMSGKLIAAAKEKNYKLNLDINPKFIGGEYPEMKNIKPVMTDKSPEDFKIEPGIVYLFDFWATWCGPCQGPMAHNQHMLEEHPEWEGKVKILGLSLDDSSEDPKKKVTEKGWTKVEHYWLEGGFNSPIAQNFQINGIPFCVLVGKDGLIKLTGHPMGMSLDENIPKLIAGESIESKKEGSGNAEVKDPTYTYETCKDDYKEFVSIHKDTFDSFKNMNGIVFFSYKIEEELIEVNKTFVGLSYLHYSKQSEASSALKKEFEEKFDSKVSVKFRIVEKKIFELEYGTECSKCKKSLGKCDQYLCTNCKPEVYFCQDCVAPNSEVVKIEDLVHPHGLYFIREGSEEEMKKVLIGDMECNAKAKPERIHGSFRCDLCDASVTGTHFRCACCPDFDICGECQKISDDSSHEKYAEKLEISTKKGHNLKTHVLVREEFGQMFNFFKYL